MELETTTSDLTARAACPTAARRPGLLENLASWFEALARRRAERRLIARLSRLPPRLLEDMGLNPEAIHDAVEGTWDERPFGHRFPKV